MNKVFGFLRGETSPRLLTRSERKTLIREASERAGELSTFAGVVDEQSKREFDSPYNRYRRPLRSILRSYKDSALIALHEYLHQEYDTSSQRMHASDFIREISKREYEVDGTDVREYLTYGEAIKKSFGPVAGMRFVAALGSYHQLPDMEDYSDADEETRKAVEALLVATSKLSRYVINRARDAGAVSKSYLDILNGDNDAVSETYQTNFFIKVSPEHTSLSSDELVDLIIAHPDEVEYITDLIIKEDIKDIGFIRSRIESNTQSLREGIL